jgi:hypothetical protein
MLLKNLSDISLQDIQTLCDNHVSEGDSIEFKAAAIGRSDEDRRELLADVCAFANASGGDLILGVREKDGVADDVCGIEVANQDAERLFLTSLVGTGLEPRYSSLEPRWLPIPGTTRGVMVLRVPRSWSAPHRVTFRKDIKFYVRNSAGKHPMSVDELRQAFNFSATVSKRMRAFRDERISAIRGEFGLNRVLDGPQLPFDVGRGPKITVLIVPLSAMVDPLDLHIQDRQIINVISTMPVSPALACQYCLEGLALTCRGS